jgi:hypothetical protein
VAGRRVPAKLCPASPRRLPGLVDGASDRARRRPAETDHPARQPRMATGLRATRLRRHRRPRRPGRGAVAGRARPRRPQRYRFEGKCAGQDFEVAVGMKDRDGGTNGGGGNQTVDHLAHGLAAPVAPTVKSGRFLIVRGFSRDHPARLLGPQRKIRTRRRSTRGSRLRARSAPPSIGPCPALRSPPLTTCCAPCASRR